uniref:Protein RIC1 homolog n=1 Tax=Syphacia muris TaxID=451379 RepID=A0A0N5AX60_9BILA
DGSEHSLRLPGCSSDETESVFCVVGNRDHTLFAAITSSSIYLFLSDTQLLTCVFRRSAADVEEKGEYRLLYWRQDSTALCTSKNYLLIYHVEISAKQCYNLVEPKDEDLRRASQELFIKAKRPKTKILLSVVARLDSVATCVVPLREEIFICLQNSWLHRLRWDGTTDDENSFFLSEVAFASDQLQFKPEYIMDNSIYVVDIVYAPLVGGFCIVLSDGRAAILTSPSSRFHPQQILGVWASQLKDAVCTAANHKFRTIIFGCRGGEIASFHLDDVNGAFVCAYRISLSVKDGSELISRLGSVNHVECSPHGLAFAAVWSPLNKDDIKDENVRPLAPILAIFTAFGAQLWCSLESSTDREINNQIVYNWVDWGPEGFSLWLGSNCGLYVLPLSRSIAICNPNMEHLERIVFVSSNRVYVSPAKYKEQSASAPHSVWRIFNVPNDYLSSNWPLRFVSIDRENYQWLIVAGTRGFTHCNMLTDRWRLFGNESQEKDMLVTGGLAVWKRFAIVSCYDVNRDNEELRFYPFDSQLDNQYCIRHGTDSRVLMLSRREDKLVTFDMDERIFIYGLSLKEGSTAAKSIIVERCAEIRICDLVPHSVCVISVQLTSLGHDPSTIKFCSNIDTVLINVSGKLIMLNPVLNESPLANLSSDDDEDYFQLSQPMLIASHVEHMWHDVAENGDSLSFQKPHLAQALWLNCGAKGMKVWMPLFLSSQSSNSVGSIESNRAFISKRIMLPFELDIYPLVICSKDCLALGVESSPSFLNLRTAANNEEQSLSLYNVHRNSEVFLHHLLRQLLKRNLGMYALEIAGTCTHLPYFGHVLELLLHSVLEEEATSSEPIPDPLLPRVVAFIQEFPNFLQTVAHCARKTELSLWPFLFNVTKHPKELFEICIRDDQLETAASFLIILQNMENAVASREHAGILLEEALIKRRWLIARDIVRFLSAIAPTEIDNSPRPDTFQKPQNVGSGRRATHVSPKDPEDTDSFVFGAISPGFVFILLRIITRPRHSHSESGVGASVIRKDSNSVSNKKLSKASASDLPVSSLINCNSMHVYLEEILKKHAACLLEDYSIRDLGSFAAHLDFDLGLWLSNNKLSGITLIKNFGHALMRLHAQFSWPYPIASQSVVRQLTKQIEEMRTSQSCASLASLSTSSLGNVNTPANSLSVVDETRPSVNLNNEFNFSKASSSTKSYGCGNHESTKNKKTLPESPTSITSSEDSDWEGLEPICGEAATRGLRESEVEMRYLLDIMYDACCAEWTFMLCLVLRDVDYLYKKITADFLKQCGPNALRRIKLGVAQLEAWASTNCFGYRTLMLAFDKHLQSLSSLMPIDSVDKTCDEPLSSSLQNKFASGPVSVTNTISNVQPKSHFGVNHLLANGDISQLPTMNGAVPDIAKKQFASNSNIGFMLKNTFSPPVEESIDANNGEKSGNYEKSIRPGMEVVSHVNFDENDQCLLM